METLMSKRILFLDDEELILKSLKRLFGRSEYDCTYMNNPVKTLEHLKYSRYDLVVSDIRMPEMDGYEFLKTIKKIYPETVRIALSGFSDNDTVLKLVNENISRIYLFKPWDNNELLAVVRKVFKMREIFSDRAITHFISNIDELPTLPSVYFEVTDLIVKNASVSRISKIIEEDQTLTSKILRIANSAFYGRKIASINDAIMNIGLNNIKNIILSATIIEESDKLKYRDKLWEHASFSNVILSQIYEELLLKKIPKMYSSVGLLHDIGKLAFYMFNTSEYEGLICEAEKGVTHLSNLEESLFGLNHEVLGAYLMDWWELPVSCVEASLYHRDPLSKDIINAELLLSLNLASTFSIETIFPKFKKTEIKQSIYDTLGVKREDVENLVIKLVEAREGE